MTTTERAGEVNGGNNDNHNDGFVWGTAAIAATIGRTPRQTYHLITIGALKSVQKKGGRYVASRAALLKELGA